MNSFILKCDETCYGTVHCNSSTLFCKQVNINFGSCSYRNTMLCILLVILLVILVFFIKFLNINKVLIIILAIYH